MVKTVNVNIQWYHFSLFDGNILYQVVTRDLCNYKKAYVCYFETYIRQL